MMAENETAGCALWWVLVACWIVRLVGMTSGTTALWGLDAAAYLPAWFAWMTWALPGVALYPPVGAALTGGLQWIGRQLEKPSRQTLIVLFAVVAIGLLYLPDRVGFTGDFLLRLSSAKASGWPSVIFPQALPLDLLLHYSVPHELARLGIAPVELTSRVLDALEAGGLALLIATLVRRSGARGVALAVASLVILAGAPLAIFTGLNKAFTELIVLAAALAVITLPGPTSFGRAVTVLAIFAVALALHRAALILAPVVMFALGGWLGRAAGREPPWKRAVVAVMVLVAGVLAWRVLFPVAGVDLRRGLIWPLHHASVSLVMRSMDLANLAALLAPVLVLVPVVMLDPRVRQDFNGATGWWCACLAVPAALLIGVVDAPQGYFRDWDMFAIAGLLLSVVSAVAIARFLMRTRQWAWLGPAVAFSTLVPCVQLLVLQNNAPAGLRRVVAFADGRPRRSATLRAGVLAFLGKRAWDMGDPAAAATYGRRAAELSPSPSVLTLWGDAEALQGHYVAAESVYVRLLAASPGYQRAWLGLARARLESGRPIEATAAAESGLAIEPGSAYGVELGRVAREAARRARDATRLGFPAPP